MIGYSQVHFKVQHSDGRTTFIIKKFISFEYLCPYSLVLVRHTYTLMNIITEIEPDADNL
ncbi:hypothetical protein C1H46_040598 [Malus baccata]|uniref:Uncharacterized protein n=1 Tax=Malus baccata TaxID=106549 RepID=A0A540KI45_MALBA|nr:hypothetical protein C1H46_040598 [Malus baccata]